MKVSVNSDRHRQAQRAWLKYKVNKAQAFVTGGYTPDNPLDALIVGSNEGNKLMFASKVRNGFVPRLQREVWSKLSMDTEHDELQRFIWIF